MYCRSCHYDLRGQEVARCSECGREFDPADARTYCARIPRLGDRVFPSLRLISPVLVTCLFAGLYCLFPSITRCGTLAGELVAPERNAQNIAQAWIAAVVADPTAVQRLPDDLASRVPAALSPYQERSSFGRRYQWQGWVECEGRAALMGFALYAAAMIWALPLRFRRLPKVGLLACIPLLTGTYFAAPIARLRWPDSHAYLQDYRYVQPKSWQVDARDQQRIILFEKRPIRPGHRLVAHKDGTVGSLTEIEFQQVAAEQGIDTNEAPGE